MYGIEGHPSLSGIKPPFLKAFVNNLVNVFFRFKYGKFYREQFRLSDKVVLLSDKYRDEITRFTGWSDFSSFTAISNPLTINRPSSINTNKKKTVLHVGLLSKQKRQDLLLEIWKRVEENRPEWSLKIIGDGPLYTKLTEKAHVLQLQRVEFLGFQSPQPYYDEASLFCLTSGYEGFGLVLVESMAYGCIPMAFNSWDVAADIIDSGINGVLIPPFDVDSYTQQLLHLMDDETRREDMARQAMEKSHAFDSDRISRSWGNLLEGLEQNKRHIKERQIER